MEYCILCAAVLRAFATIDGDMSDYGKVYIWDRVMAPDKSLRTRLTSCSSAIWKSQLHTRPPSSMPSDDCKR